LMPKSQEYLLQLFHIPGDNRSIALAYLPGTAPISDHTSFPFVSMDCRCPVSSPSVLIVSN
jgi:hypothetical protein